MLVREDRRNCEKVTMGGRYKKRIRYSLDSIEKSVPLMITRYLLHFLLHESTNDVDND